MCLGPKATSQSVPNTVYNLWTVTFRIHIRLHEAPINYAPNLIARISSAIGSNCLLFWQLKCCQQLIPRQLIEFKPLIALPTFVSGKQRSNEAMNTEIIEDLGATC